MTIRVLYVHHDGQNTGSAISLMNMLNALKQEVECHVLFLQPGPVIATFREAGFQVYQITAQGHWTTPGPRWRERATFFNFLALVPDARIRKLVKQINPDIIHLNDKTSLVAAVSCLGLRIPVVTHIRGTYYFTKWWVHKLISTVALKLVSNRIIAISEDEGHEFREPQIIYNTINQAVTTPLFETNRKLKQQPGKPIEIGWVGRFSTSKGAWDFIEMARQAITLHPDKTLRFHMVGKLPDENAIEWIGGKPVHLKQYLHDLIQASGLKNHITLHGYRSDYLEFMAQMDVMVNCNRLGAFGRQAIETMSVGTAQVATCRFPGRSSILNKETGLVVKEGDVNALTTALSQLIGNPSLREEMGQKALAFAQSQFSYSNQAAKVKHIYQQLLPI